MTFQELTFGLVRAAQTVRARRLPHPGIFLRFAALMPEGQAVQHHYRGYER
jgi:hypothetical protein